METMSLESKTDLTVGLDLASADHAPLLARAKSGKAAYVSTVKETIRNLDGTASDRLAEGAGASGRILAFVSGGLASWRMALSAQEQS